MTPDIRRRLLLACAGAIIASAPAGAQVAPPPTDEPEQQEEYTPPQQQPQRGMTVRPNRAQPADGETVLQQQRKRVAPPNIPFRTMVIRGEDGRVLRYTRPPALMALANNPTVAENARDRVMPVVYERHVRQEERILQNLDLYLGFEFGMHEDMDMGNIEQLSRITRQIKPLSESGDIATDLEDAGVFSPSQRAMNNLIVQDYKKAISDELKLEHGNDIGPMFAQIIDDALIEPKYVYGLMVKELLERGPAAIDKAGLADADGIDRLRAVLEGGWPEDSEGQQFAIGEAKAALSNLTLDQHEAILRASRDMREDPGVPPIPEVKLSVGGQVGFDESKTRLKMRKNEVQPEDGADDMVDDAQDDAQNQTEQEGGQPGDD